MAGTSLVFDSLGLDRITGWIIGGEVWGSEPRVEVSLEFKSLVLGGIAHLSTGVRPVACRPLPGRNTAASGFNLRLEPSTSGIVSCSTGVEGVACIALHGRNSGALGFSLRLGKKETARGLSL